MGMMLAGAVVTEDFRKLGQGAGKAGVGEQGL